MATTVHDPLVTVSGWSLVVLNEIATAKTSLCPCKYGLLRQLWGNVDAWYVSSAMQILNDSRVYPIPGLTQALSESKIQASSKHPISNEIRRLFFFLYGSVLDEYVEQAAHILQDEAAPEHKIDRIGYLTHKVARASILCAMELNHCCSGGCQHPPICPYAEVHAKNCQNHQSLMQDPGYLIHFVNFYNLNSTAIKRVEALAALATNPESQRLYVSFQFYDVFRVPKVRRMLVRSAELFEKVVAFDAPAPLVMGLKALPENVSIYPKKALDDTNISHYHITATQGSPTTPDIPQNTQLGADRFERGERE